MPAQKFRFHRQSQKNCHEGSERKMETAEGDGERVVDWDDSG